MWVSGGFCRSEGSSGGEGGRWGTPQWGLGGMGGYIGSPILGGVMRVSVGKPQPQTMKGKRMWGDGGEGGHGGGIGCPKKRRGTKTDRKRGATVG